MHGSHLLASGLGGRYADKSDQQRDEEGEQAVSAHGTDDRAHRKLREAAGANGLQLGREGGEMRVGAPLGGMGSREAAGPELNCHSPVAAHLMPLSAEVKLQDGGGGRRANQRAGWAGSCGVHIH